MLADWSVVTAAKTRGGVGEVKGIYGSQATMSRVGVFNLIHLDRPSRDEIRRRVAGFNPEELFDERSPLSRMIRQQGADVVFMGKRRENG